MRSTVRIESSNLVNLLEVVDHTDAEDVYDIFSKASNQIKVKHPQIKIERYSIVEKQDDESV